MKPKDLKGGIYALNDDGTVKIWFKWFDKRRD